MVHESSTVTSGQKIMQSQNRPPGGGAATMPISLEPSQPFLTAAHRHSALQNSSTESDLEMVAGWSTCRFKPMTESSRWSGWLPRHGSWGTVGWGPRPYG